VRKGRNHCPRQKSRWRPVAELWPIRSSAAPPARGSRAQARHRMAHRVDSSAAPAQVTAPRCSRSRFG
jgi:hypothetical protein